MFGVQMIDESEQERKQICSAIGERMRRARKENDITLDILAQRTGFSKSYLSQIENMKREPTIGTLTKIAYAMSIDALFLISGLQQEAEGKEFTVVRADERKVMPDAFRLKGLKYESLAYKKHDRLMDAYIVEMGPDFPQNTKPWQGQEFTFVLEGTHEFVYDGKSHLMHEGDAYYFDSTKPYKGRRIGAKPARILVVFTSTEGKTGLHKRREGRSAGRSPQNGRS
ncbi:MAG: XRE family transcriptional regulator [Syntrophorhabdales bacterium]|jgi:transcriptional regulator with XRE-family HTH domain